MSPASVGTFFVSYIGVVTRLIGLSAQGLVLEGAVAVIVNGECVKNNPIKIGIASNKGWLRKRLGGWYLTGGSMIGTSKQGEMLLLPLYRRAQAGGAAKKST
jgi:hypothetical protein